MANSFANENNLLTKKSTSSFVGSLSPRKNSPSPHFKAEDLIYDYSPNTARCSALFGKFPKAERFPILKQTSKSQSKLYLPSTLSPIATSFGYGNKMIMSSASFKAALETPSPDLYNPKLLTERNKGKTFGLSYEAYKKVYLPHTHIVLPEIGREVPGPGEYKIKEGFSFDGKGCTLRPRRKMFNDVTEEKAPPSNYYSPSRLLVEPQRYKKISFGIGGRYDFTKEGPQSPGPGTYKIPSKFDAYRQRTIFQSRLHERLKRSKQ